MQTKAISTANETSSDTRLSLSGKWVELQPVEVDHYSFLYQLSLQEAARGVWRFYGTTPSPEQFVQLLWTDVLAQLMIVRKDNQQPLGLATSYQADFRNGHAWIAFMLDSSDPSRSVGLEGGSLFIDYLFDAFPFRKLYAETHELAVSSFRSGIGSAVVEEGRLCEYHYWKDQFWDWIYLSIERDAWRSWHLENDERLSQLRAAIRAVSAEEMHS